MLNNHSHRLAVRSFYNEIASYYDILMRRKAWDQIKEQKGEEWLIDLLKKNQGDVCKILDCGCGTGVHTVRLSQVGHHVIGCDISRGMLDKARENIKKYSTYPPSQLIEYDFTKLGEIFEDEEFDAVICVGSSLLHLSSFEELRNTIMSMLKILKPNGICIFEVDNLEFIRHNRTDKQAFHIEQIICSEQTELMAFDIWTFSDLQVNSHVFIMENIESEWRIKESQLPFFIYTPEEIAKFMDEIGFSNIKIKSPGFATNELSSLILMVNSHQVVLRESTILQACKSAR